MLDTLCPDLSQRDESSLFLTNEKKGLEINISIGDIRTLLENGILIEGIRKRSECSNLNTRLSRSLSWFSTCDCAILTAWRSKKARKENDSNNRDMQLILRSYGYGVSKVRGCYAEKGLPVSRENSFLVFDTRYEPVKFYERIFELAAKYDQDCFLYKKAGEAEPAYLIGTNKDFGMNKRKLAGMLRVGSSDAENYSRVGSGKISFE